MKKVLILSGSPRKGGNSDLLCDEFMRGAKERGNDAEKIRVAEKNIEYCRACYYCKRNGKCVVDDDMGEVLDKMLAADVIVLASPVYFYSISAQLKTVVDRTVVKWLQFQNKEFYYIVIAAEEGEGVTDCTLECFRGMAACFKGSREMGIIRGQGVYEKGEINGAPAMRQAYEMGRSV